MWAIAPSPPRNALTCVTADRLGQATGLTRTMRNFGVGVGLAVLGTALSRQTTEG